MQQFDKYDLGYLDGGQIVEVTLVGSTANVRLMDYSNLQAYRSGREHHYYGGLPESSPMHITVPRPGNWFITIDMVGLRGTTRHSVRILSVA